MRKLTPHMVAFLVRLFSGDEGGYLSDFLSGGRQYGPVRKATILGLVSRGLVELVGDKEAVFPTDQATAWMVDTRRMVLVDGSPVELSVEPMSEENVAHHIRIRRFTPRHGEPMTYVTDIEQAHDQANTEVVVRFVADRLSVKVLSTDGLNNVGRLANQVSRWALGYSEYTLNDWSKVESTDVYPRQWEIMSEVSEHHGCADRATMYLLRNRYNRQQWITSRACHLTNLY